MQLTKQELHEDLLVHGVVLKDKTFTTVSGTHRIRIIKMLGNMYYDYVWNNEVIECEEIF